MALKSHRILAVAALTTLASQNASAFTPQFLGRASATKIFSTDTDVSIDYDAAAKLAYDQWRVVNDKGDFNEQKYSVFKSNYEAITIANVKAAKKARDEGLSIDDVERLELNEYADMTAEDYMAMQRGDDAPVSAINAAMDAIAAQDAASGAIGDAAAALADEEQKLAESLGLNSVEELEAAMDEIEGISDDGGEIDPTSYIREAYIKWCKEFGKKEDESRFPTFSSNFLAMEEYAKENGKVMQLNKYADCTEEEYIALTSKGAQEVESEKTVDTTRLEKEPKKLEDNTAALEAKKAEDEAAAMKAKMAEETAEKAKKEKEAAAEAEAKAVAKKKADDEAKAKAEELAKAKAEIAKKTAADIEKEKQQRQAEQEKARVAAAAEAEAAAIAAAKAIAEKEAAQVARRRAFDEQAAEIERQKARDVEMKLATTKKVTNVVPVPKSVEKVETSKPEVKKEIPIPKPEVPKSVPVSVSKPELSTEEPLLPKPAPVVVKARKEVKDTQPSLFSGLLGKSTPAPTSSIENKEIKRQFSFGNPNKIAAKKAATMEKEEADAAAITAAIKAATKEAIAEKAAVSKSADEKPRKESTAPLFGGFFASKSKVEPVAPPIATPAPTPPSKTAPTFNFLGTTKSVEKKIEAPVPDPAPVATKKPESFSFFSKPVAKKVEEPVPPPTPAPKPSFSLFGGVSKPAAKKVEEPLPPPAATPATKPAFSLFGGVSKPAAKKVEEPLPPPAPKPAFSLFGGASKPAVKTVPPPAPAPPSQKKQAPSIRRGTISLGSQMTSSSKTDTSTKNDGIPTLSNWKQEADGSITGNIKNSKMFRQGQKITTSPVKKGAKAGTVVTTSSGSKYRLL